MYALARKPCLIISSAVSFAASILKSKICTWAPCLAKVLAMDWPMPLPPPVIIAIFFSKENQVINKKNAKKW